MSEEQWYDDEGNGVVVEGGVSFFDSEDVPYRKRIASPTSPLNDGVNLGDRFLLDSSIDGLPYPVAEAEWLVDGSHELVGLTRILTVKRQDLMSQAPGSWVVSLEARVTDPESVITSNPLVAAPLVAKVTYGSGGISQYFEVDAFRSMFSVPANEFQVEVGWRQPGTSFGDSDGVGVVTFNPLEVEVSATAHRSLETGESIPTVSYFLNRQSGAAAGIINQQIFIPPQAVSWCLSMPLAVPLGTALTTGAGVFLEAADTSGGNPARTDVVDSAQLVSMIRGRCFREIPALTEKLNINLDLNGLGGFPILSYCLLTFRLGI